MAITLQAFARVTTLPPAEPVPSAVALVTSRETSSGVVADVVVGTDVLAALVPRQLTQIVHVGAVVRLALGSVTLDAQDIVAWSCEEDEEGLLTWELSLAAQVVDVFDNWKPGPILTEQKWGGAPPPGPNSVHLTIALETVPGRAVEFVVVGDGVTVKATRPVSGSERVLRISGAGAWGRIDRRPVSLILPAGHGTTHGELSREFLRLLGLPTARLPGAFGEALTSPVEHRCEPGWREAVLVADGACRRLRWSQDYAPRISAIPLIPDVGARPVREIGMQDILLGYTADVEADGDVPSRYVVTGSRVELPDAGDGSVTTETVVQVFDNAFVVPGAYFLQRSTGPNAGELIAQSPDLTPRRHRVSRVTTRVTTLNGCKIVEEVITEGWLSPKAARYAQNVPIGDQDPAEPTYRPVYIYDENAAQDDQAEGYLDEYFRFGEISRTRVESSWGTIRDAGGLTIEQRRILQNDSRTGGIVFGRPDRPGDLRLRTTYVAQWRNPRRALRNGDQYIDGVNLTAGGVGVLYDHEAYMRGPGDPPQTTTDTPIRPDGLRRIRHWLSVTREVYQGDDFGYLLRKNSVAKVWGVDLERKYYYDDEVTSSAEWEIQQEDPEIDIVLAATSLSSHTSVERVLDPKKQLIPNGETVTFSGEYLPRREYCDAAGAAAGSNRPVSGECSCNSGAFHDQNDVQEIDHPYVETDASALKRALIECIRDHAPTVTFSILVDPRLRSGDPIVVDLPDAGIYRRPCWIHRVRVEKPARGPGEPDPPVIMTLTVKIDPRT